jgi:hypothetical protein
MSLGPRIRIRTRMAGRDLDEERCALRSLGRAVAAAIVLLLPLGAPGYGVPVTVARVALVTSALTAASIVDNARRMARGPQR